MSRSESKTPVTKPAVRETRRPARAIAAIARAAGVAPALLALTFAAGCADPLMRKSNLPEKIDFSGGGSPPPVAVRAPETGPAAPGANVGAPGNPEGVGTATPATREMGAAAGVADTGATRPAVAGEVGASTRTSDVDLTPVPAGTRRPTSGPAATLPALPSRIAVPTTGPG